MNCKVIATSFAENRCVSPNTLDAQGNPSTKYPDHHQDINNKEDFLKRMKMIVELEKSHTDTPFDVLIINSDSGYIEGNEYIKGLNGTKTDNGTIYTLTRPNIGWSFGAYNDAFKHFPNYNHYLFTEDDIIFNALEYYKKLLQLFLSREGVGFVSPIGYSDTSFRPRHAHGGVGLTSKHVLKRVEEKIGKLPHHGEVMSGETREYKYKVCQEGEVPFTNEIYKLGYEMVTYGNGQEWNMEKNLCLPYFNFIHT